MFPLFLHTVFDSSSVYGISSCRPSFISLCLTGAVNHTISRDSVVFTSHMDCKDPSVCVSVSARACSKSQVVS